MFCAFTQSNALCTKLQGFKELAKSILEAGGSDSELSGNCAQEELPSSAILPAYSAIFTSRIRPWFAIGFTVVANLQLVLADPFELIQEILHRQGNTPAWCAPKNIVGAKLHPCNPTGLRRPDAIGHVLLDIAYWTRRDGSITE